MSAVIPPRALYMILCDEVLRDEQHLGKLTAAGVTTLIKWDQSAPTASIPKLAVLLVVTDGHGEGTSQIVCRNLETGMPVFHIPERSLSFEGKNPTGHYAVTRNITDCSFPAPGAYTVQFLFDETVVAEQLLIVR